MRLFSHSLFSRASSRSKSQPKAQHRKTRTSASSLHFETLEPRQMLTSVVIAPVNAELASVGDSYIEYGTIVDIETGNTNGDNWYNGSGLADPTIVQTGDPVPAVWPEHISGNHSSRVSRIRNASEVNQLTFDLGGTFDVSAMVLWNSTEQHNSVLQTDRGFENTRLSYSTDGGITFVGNDLLTWTERVDEASEGQTTNTFGPEVQVLPAEVYGVTHIRMDVDNFSPNGSDDIVMASEVRFIGEQLYPGPAGEILADYQFVNHAGRGGGPDLISRDTATNSTASDITSPLTLSGTDEGQPGRALLLGPAWDRTFKVESGSNADDYIEFTLTPDSGQSLDLDFLTFQLYRSEPDSKNSFAVYYDQAGPGSDNFNSLLHVGQVNSEDTWEAIDVSLRGRPDLTTLSTEVKFRIFFWGADGVDDLYVDNVRVHEVGTNIIGSTYAHYGPSGRLIQPLDELGNRLPDFSAAGYKYGNEPIPDVDALLAGTNRIVTVSPGAGDDGSLIQNAINQVSAFSLLPNGFRGMVQLSAGEYQIAGSIDIGASGVVFRGVGDGDNPANSTILRATGTDDRSLVKVGTSTNPSHDSSTQQQIVDKYVPVGATSFTITDASEFAVGMEIRIVRPSPANWITDIEMDQIPPKTDGGTLNQWSAGSRDMRYERIITRIEGNRIFFNAPVLNSFDQQYGGGQVYKLNTTRITDVGIESIRGKSDFASNTDENHARNFIQLDGVKDAWVRNITGQHFIYATVNATGKSKAVTVEDARSLDPKSQITGGRRYAFNIEGQFILMRDLYSEEGRHDFVNNASGLNHGPNVFLNGVAENTHQNIGPHQRWATGTLYDTITSNRDIEARDGGNAGSGHGWRGANMVFWNVTAPGLYMQNPITAQNWFIGATGTDRDILTNARDSANMDSREQPIDFGDPDNPTNSLYIAQRNQADAKRELVSLEYVYGDYDLGTFDGVPANTSVVIAPVDAELAIVGNSYIEYGTIVDIETGNTNGDNWYNGSGLEDASIVDTGDPVPASWPEHVTGNNASRVSRIRNAPEVNQLTFDLGGAFDIDGMTLWNSTEEHNGTDQTDRGFENTLLSYSTDGGVTFVGADLLTWTRRSDEVSNATFGPEVQALPARIEDVTHIRMQVDNFSPSGSDNIVMASEIRFFGAQSEAISTIDDTNADAGWVAAVEASSGMTALTSMDGNDEDGILPISLAPALTANEQVTSALLSIGIRNLDDANTGELWVDSVLNRRSFASLGVLASATYNRTQVVTLELTGEDLEAFADGRLDLAVSDAVVDWVNLQIDVGEQTPFGGSAQVVTEGSRVEAENFDEGGEGVAYHDFDTGNNGSDYRTDTNVDIGANTDGGSQGHNIGWIRDTEFLEYTVDVTAGNYHVSARVASADADPGDLRLLVGNGPTGTDFAELGVFEVESTGGWGNWTTVTINDIPLSDYAGAGQVLRLEMVGGSFNINWLEFASTLAGDYNNDGSIDQSDYTVWRANYGSTTDLAADGNHDNVVDAADYTVWRNNLGAGIDVASATTPMQVSSNHAVSEATRLLGIAPKRTDDREADVRELASPIFTPTLARRAGGLEARTRVFAEYSGDEVSDRDKLLLSLLSRSTTLSQDSTNKKSPEPLIDQEHEEPTHCIDEAWELTFEV